MCRTVIFSQVHFRKHFSRNFLSIEEHQNYSNVKVQKILKFNMNNVYRPCQCPYPCSPSLLSPMIALKVQYFGILWKFVIFFHLAICIPLSHLSYSTSRYFLSWVQGLHQTNWHFSLFAGTWPSSWLSGWCHVSWLSQKPWYFTPSLLSRISLV